MNLSSKARKWISALLLGVFSTSVVVPAQAITIGFTAGIDSKTRALIAQMPLEIRQQIEVLIANALPMVDKSVMSYLAEVDRILAVNLSRATCVGAGVSKIAIEELFAKLPGGGKVGPTIISDLQNQINNYPDEMKKDSTPSNYRQAYGNYLHNTYVVGCAVEATPIAQTEVQKLRVELTARVLPWIRIDDKECSDARACLAFLVNRTRQEIEAADPRDVKSTDAKKRLDAIAMPKTGFLVKFNPLPYEAGIRSAFEISDSLKLTALVRNAYAKEAVDSASAMTSIFEAALRNATAAIDTTQAQIKQAANDVKARRGDRAGIEKATAEGLALSAEVKPQADSVLARANTASGQIDPLIKSLDASLVRVVERDRLNAIKEEARIRFSDCKGGGGRSPRECGGGR